MSIHRSRSITGINNSKNPMDVLCTDFLKLDLSNNGKENILIMMDSFSKFAVSAIMSNQQTKMVVKALVDSWSYTY